MRVRTQTEINIPLAPEAVFDLAMLDTTLPSILRPAFPIPGVTRIELRGGDEVRPGVKRHAFMTDKSVMVEEIVTHVRPREHTYKWAAKPPLPLRPILRAAKGSWKFEPVASGTRIVWSYSFELTSPLAFVHGHLIALLFRRWMQQGLGRLAALASA
jgi:hypothetical protein